MAARDHIPLNLMMNVPEIRIRAFNEDEDLQQVDELEKNCEAGPSGKVSLFTDLLGDPLCRVRNYPAYAMLVAETQPDKEIVGLIRAGVKHIVRGMSTTASSHERDDGTSIRKSPGTPVYTKAAYISGLRVSPLCRRMGIGLQLVKKMEDWCKEQRAEYVYIATEKDNEASVNLFTHKLAYTKFRTPAILVQPLYAKAKRLSSKVHISKLNAADAETLYRSVFGTREFFPKDIDVILGSRLHNGTWLAYCKGEGDILGGFDELGEEDVSWAVISIWRYNEIVKFEMRGVSRPIRGCAAVTRFVDKLIPWVTIPSMPNVFKPFGLQIMYGLHAQGKNGRELLENLCWHAHNLAKEEGCQVIAAEMGACDPLKESIPHWRRFSEEDLWCIKRLDEHPADQDWCKFPPPPSLFLDPRDF